MTRRTVKSPKSKQPRDWAVYRIGGRRAGLVGHVTAIDKEAAVERALDEFDVAPADRRRLVAQPLGS